MLCFNLGCIGQYSWPAAGENHRRRRVHRGERRHTACLLGRCWFLLSALSAPYLCGELQPDTLFFSPTHTPLLHPHRCIFMWMNVWFLCTHWLAGPSQKELLNLEEFSSVPQVPVPGGSTALPAFRRNSAQIRFLLRSLPNWPNLDQWWLNEHIIMLVFMNLGKVLTCVCLSQQMLKDEV